MIKREKANTRPEMLGWKSISLVHSLSTTVRDLDALFEVPILVKDTPERLPFVVLGVKYMLPGLIERFEPSHHVSNMHHGSNVEQLFARG